MEWISILVTVIKQTLKKAQEKYGTIEYSKILDTVFFGIQWKCYGLELQKEWKYHISPCILHSLSKDEIGWLSWWRIVKNHRLAVLKKFTIITATRILGVLWELSFCWVPVALLAKDVFCSSTSQGMAQ